MPPTADVWREAYAVRSSETDAAGRASVQALLGYLLDAADGHARALGVSADDMADEGRTWMLHRLRVAVEATPRWRDAVRVETWPAVMDGLYAERDFWLRGEDGRPLVRATSTWLLIDVKRRRPVRLPEPFRAFARPDRERPLPEDGQDPASRAGQAVPPLGAPDYEKTFRVGYGDLDLNQHATFSRYALWAVETLPFEVLQTHALAELDLRFRAETVYGDVLRTQTQRLDGEEAAFAHRLVREKDGREAAQALTRWREA